MLRVFSSGFYDVYLPPHSTLYFSLAPHLSITRRDQQGSNYSAHAGVSTLMGYLEDRSHLKNQYGTGTMWRPGSACQPPRQTMFATPNKTFMARPNAAFSMGWREQLQAQRARRRMLYCSSKFIY